MKACPDQYEKLMLDVHNELSPREQAEWQAHLAHCLGCRTEHSAMKKMLRDVCDQIPAATLAPDRADSMTRNILTLTAKPSGGWWRKWLGRATPRWIPALATASVCLIMLTWFGYTVIKPTGVTNTGGVITAQIPKEDLEIINNLYLLKEMDALNKLVQAVDFYEYGPPKPHDLLEGAGPRKQAKGYV